MKYQGSFTQFVVVNKVQYLLQVDEYKTFFDCVLSKVGSALPCFMGKVSRKEFMSKSYNVLVKGMLL